MAEDVKNWKTMETAESDSGTASNPEGRGSLDSSDTYAKYGITNIPKTTVTTAIGQVNTHFHFVMRPDS